MSVITPEQKPVQPDDGGAHKPITRILVKKPILTTLSVLIGAFLTWLVFRGTDWSAVGGALERTNPRWLLPAAAAFVAGHAVRAYRWSLILKAAVLDTRFRHVFSGVMIGDLAQLSLPLKAGLFVRAMAFGRIVGQPFARIYGTANLDRLPELITLGILMVVAFTALPGGGSFTVDPDLFETSEPMIIPSAAIKSLVVVCIVVVSLRLGALVTIYTKTAAAVAFAGKTVGFFSERAGRQIQIIIGNFAETLHVMTSVPKIIATLLWSFGYWGMFVAAHACILQAMGLPWSPIAPLMLVVLTGVSMALPGAPGFLGGWHFAAVIALVATAPDMEASEMKAVAILTHVMYLLVATGLGVAGLVGENLRVTELVKRVEQLPATRKAQL